MTLMLTPGQIAVIHEVPEVVLIVAEHWDRRVLTEIGSPQTYTPEGYRIVDWSDGRCNVDDVRGMTRCAIVAPRDVIAQITRTYTRIGVTQEKLAPVLLPITTPEYATEVLVKLSRRKEDNLVLPVVLKAAPGFRLGALYTGNLRVADTTFKVEAICVQSTAGGRGWYAWDEKLESRLEILSLGDSNRRATTIDITPPGGAQHKEGEYVVCMYPCSESGTDD